MSKHNFANGLRVGTRLHRITEGPFGGAIRETWTVVSVRHNQRGRALLTIALNSPETVRQDVSAAVVCSEFRPTAEAAERKALANAKLRVTTARDRLNYARGFLESLEGLMGRLGTPGRAS